MSCKPYLRPVFKTSWYMRHGRYRRYMAREVTCFLIGAYTAVFTVGLWRLAEGRDTFEAFMAALQTPGSVIFHVIAFAFSIYHSTTWFNVTPQAMPLMKGDDFVPGSLIIGVHYVTWVVVSLAILVAVVVGGGGMNNG